MADSCIKSITKKNFVDGTIYRVDLQPPYDDYGAILKDNGQLEYIYNTRTAQKLAQKVALKNLPPFLINAFKSAELCVKNSITNDT